MASRYINFAVVFFCSGAVGETQFVQMVNGGWAVFNKVCMYTYTIPNHTPFANKTLLYWIFLPQANGAILAGPFAGNSLFQSLGGGCAAYDDGDPIVLYDRFAKRWIITQFVVSATPYLECVAVSTTSDATGSYYTYSFSYASSFNDYPKLGIWGNSYFMTYNIFSGNNYLGPLVCAWDRAAMLRGDAAPRQVCYQISNSYGSILPADANGRNPPPANAPNYMFSMATNSLNMWKFSIDWTGANAVSSVSSPINIPVAVFNVPCNGAAGDCIPQSGTTNKLDTLGDRLMYTAFYRNFGTYESIVLTHAVAAGTSVGVRWYEIRNPGGTPPLVHQQSTFAPDSAYRWLSSGAMDANGNIAMGYTKSSSTSFPSVAITARLASDALNTMQTETIVKAGGGSQLLYSNRNFGRWGDYSQMSLDPVDDCTFWYTSEYLPSSGTFNWNTWITSFKFPSCNADAPSPPASPPPPPSPPAPPLPLLTNAPIVDKAINTNPASIALTFPVTANSGNINAYWAATCNSFTQSSYLTDSRAKNTYRLKPLPALQSGQPITTSTCTPSPGFDTVIALFVCTPSGSGTSGAVTDCTCFMSDDNCGSGLGSSVSTPYDPTKDYYFVIMPYNVGSTGSWTLTTSGTSIPQPPPPPRPPPPPPRPPPPPATYTIPAANIKNFWPPSNTLPAKSWTQSLGNTTGTTSSYVLPSALVSLCPAANPGSINTKLTTSTYRKQIWRMNPMPSTANAGYTIDTCDASGLSTFDTMLAVFVCNQVTADSYSNCACFTADSGCGSGKLSRVSNVVKDPTRVTLAVILPFGSSTSTGSYRFTVQ